MALLEINRNPSRRELGWFGVSMTAVLAVLGGIAYWRFHAPVVAQVFGIASLLTAVLYLTIPAARRPLYLIWMFATYPIGWLLSHVILAVAYFLVITPIGLLMRICGYDPMQRQIDHSTRSYWIPRPASRESSSYFRQF